MRDFGKNRDAGNSEALGASENRQTEGTEESVFELVSDEIPAASRKDSVAGFDGESTFGKEGEAAYGEAFSNGGERASRGGGIPAPKIRIVRSPFSCCFGCFLLAFTVVALAFGSLFYLFRTGTNLAVSVVPTLQSICAPLAADVRRSVKAGIEECRREPSKVVYVDYDFVSAKPADKYCAAEITEGISRRIERKKWGFSSEMKIELEAVFKYCVPLGKMRIEIAGNSESPECVKIRGIFGALELDTPVSHRIRNQTLNRSLFPRLNDDALQYVSVDLPAEIETKGRSTELMYIAASEAKKSLETFFREGLLPMLGFSKRDISKFDVEIKFDPLLGSINSAPIPENPDLPQSGGVAAKKEKNDGK